MEAGYRSARACPACGALLTELPTPSAVVDRCPDCGGLWIDWFDGEISTVAASARHAPPGHAADGRGAGACPDCRAALASVRHPDESSNVDILRCGSCAGAFVSRASLEAVAALGSAEPAPPDEASWLDAVLDRLRALFR